MKNAFSTAAISGILIASIMACNNDDDNSKYEIPIEDLPQAASIFVTAYFPDASYQSVEKQKKPDSDGSVYEVKLSNQFEIDFDANGKWIDIDGNNNVIPEALIPEKIKNYVTINYAEQKVIKFDRENTHIEIGLSNDIDLIFDLEGNFREIDL